MPQNWSKAVSEGNGPLPPQEQLGPDQPTLADVYRLFEEIFERQLLKQIKSRFNQQGKKLDEFMEDMRATEQRSASLEQEARKPRLAMEADVTADKKTRKRTKVAAAAVQAKQWGSCFGKRVQADPTSSTNYGMKAEPTALRLWDDVLFDKGTAAPKSCLSPPEMRTRTATGGLLPTSTASTVTRITFDQPPLWFCRPKVVTWGL